VNDKFRMLTKAIVSPCRRRRDIV